MRVIVGMTQMQLFVSSLAALTARGRSSLNNALHPEASSWPNDEESMFVSVTEFLLRICVESFFSDPNSSVGTTEGSDFLHGPENLSC